MKIIQNTDIKKLQETVALALKEALMDSHEDGVLLLLSAGSAFDMLENTSLYTLIFNNKITIGMLDERFDNNEDINNFIQFQKTNFYQRALDGGVNFIDSIPKENETIDSFSLRIEQSLRKWRSENKYGKIIITEGVGVDGHTAGIMPFLENIVEFDKLFLSDDRWVVGYNAGLKNQYPNRVTTTLSFIKKEVDISIVYIVGENKEQSFKKIVSEIGTLAETPARIVRDMKEVKIFTNIIS